MTACRSGCMKVIKLLLARGANVDVPDSSGYTALLLASAGGKIEVFKLLLTSGADIEQPDNYGNTPLILAASGRKYNRIVPLLEAGADVTATNNIGETALDHLRDHPSMLELCERYRERNMGLQKPLLK